MSFTITSVKTQRVYEKFSKKSGAENVRLFVCGDPCGVLRKCLDKEVLLCYDKSNKNLFPG